MRPGACTIASMLSATVQRVQCRRSFHVADRSESDLKMESAELHSCVRGHHVYQHKWTPTLGEELRTLCQRKHQRQGSLRCRGLTRRHDCRTCPTTNICYLFHFSAYRRQHPVYCNSCEALFGRSPPGWLGSTLYFEIHW